MADNYTHQYNAYNAIDIAGYKPRSISCLIMGANGPDPLYCYQMYNPFRKYEMTPLADKMHDENTGKFLKNLFLRARTDAQKDYCLGFLCHYAMDSTIHPYVRYVTESYGSAFNIPSGHQFFETALDSLLSERMDGERCADYEAYCPEISEMEMHQISHLLRQAILATYPEYDIPQNEYIRAFKDFKLIKSFFYSPNKLKFPLAYAAEKILGFREGFVRGHMQPSQMEIPEYPFWQNMDIGLYSVDTLDEILLHIDYMSADCIKYGQQYFAGTCTLESLMENIGDNKSYSTGLTVK